MSPACCIPGGRDHCRGVRHLAASGQRGGGYPSYSFLPGRSGHQSDRRKGGRRQSHVHPGVGVHGDIPTEMRRVLGVIRQAPGML